MKGKEWLTAEETAVRLGTSVGYVRELCIIGLTDKESGIVASKIGKCWRIPISEVNRKLGINQDEESIKTQLYIKDLESTVKNYELKINTFKNIISTLEVLVSR